MPHTTPIPRALVGAPRLAPPNHRGRLAAPQAPWRRALIGAAAALACSGGFAQTVEVAVAGERQAASLPAVVVSGTRKHGYAAAASTGATKTDAALRDLPQSVSVIPRQLIEDQAAHSLQDVLRNVPGVAMSSGDGQRDQVTIRGFSAIADQFIDGIRDDALYFRDLSNIERVEVLKGPAAVLYGRGSSGGLINRVTKKPQPGSFGEVRLELGSDSLRRGSFDLNRAATDAVGVRFTGALEDSASYRDQGFIERHSLAPSLALKLGEQTRLLLQGEIAKDKRITDFGIPSFNGRPVGVDPRTYYGSGDARRDDTTTTDVASFTAAIDHRFNEAFSVRNVTRLYRYELDRNNTLPGGTVDTATRTVGRSRGTVSRKEHGYFNQTDFKLKSELGGMRHDWLFGAEIGRQKKYQNFVSQGNIDRVSIDNPGGKVAPPIPAATSAAANPANSVFDVAGIYVQDQLTLSPQWKALVGVRHDRFEQATDFERTGVPLSRTDKNWSPRAGLVWQPSESAAYYVSLSRSYQPSGETFALAANNAGNPPERTQNQEIGAKLDLLAGALSVTGALFRLERSGIKTADPARPGVLINVGKQRTDGIELTASGRLPGAWEVFAGYAYLDGRITESNAVQASPQTPVVQIALQGKRPSLTPRHSGSVWAVRQLGGGFAAGGGVNYSSNRFASPSNAVELPGYATADLAGYYRSKTVDVALHLKNVTDRKYIVSAHGSNDNLLLPGAPRQLQVAVSYKF